LAGDIHGIIPWPDKMTLFSAGKSFAFYLFKKKLGEKVAWEEERLSPIADLTNQFY